MNWGEGNRDNLYWGTDINFDKADVDDATRSLFIRYDEQDGDFSEEIAIYKAAIEVQQSRLADHAAQETAAMSELAEMLK